MTARLHEATLDHALQIARDVDLEGPGPLLSPAVVTWLAKLALHHPQVSAAVAAALPSSGVRWAMPWAETGERYAGAQRAAADGTRLGGVLMGAHMISWRVPGVAVGDAPTVDAARAEVDERLIAAGYTLLGEVHRREPVPAGWYGEQVTVHPCVDCGARVEGGPTRCERCVAESGLGTFRALAEAAERDMPAGLLAGPPEDEECGDCDGKGHFSPWGKPSDDPSHRACMSCDGTGVVPRG